MKRWYFKLSVVIWMIFIIGTSVVAADDENKQNNIEIILSDSKENIYVKNADVALYEIAVFTDYKKHEYTVNDSYQQVMENLDFSTTEKGCTKENAEIISKYAEERKMEGIVKKTDEKGTVSFDNVKKGIYLVKVSANQEYSVDAFLVEVPLSEGGVYYDSVTAKPKIEAGSGKNNGDDGKVTGEKGYDGKKLPQTGQLKWPVPVLFILGSTLIVAGYADHCFRGGTNPM